MSLEFSKEQINDYLEIKENEIIQQFKKIVDEELDAEQFSFLKLLLIQAKVTKDKLYEELDEFYENKKQLSKFIDWIWTSINNNLSKSNKITEKNVKINKDLPNKNFEKAIQNITKNEDQTQQKTSILERVKKRQQDQKSEKSQSPPTEKKIKTELNPDKKKKCVFYPNCKKTDCPFYHPTEQCPKFPKCAFGQLCLYIHPQTTCKFGINCQRPNCSYVHPKMMGGRFPFTPMGGGMNMMSPFYSSQYKKTHRKKTENLEKTEQPIEQKI